MTEPAGLTLLKALLPAFLLICSVGSLEAGDVDVGVAIEVTELTVLVADDHLLALATVEIDREGGCGGGHR